ncbi:MAG: permease prefix domain 1-containing protein, partial [Tepidisphaeraceae bacterium]
LRMRRELLTHLQSAADEEQAHGFDEPTAIRRAVERLGNPIELARQLQGTVPWVQRLLLARIPVSKPVERWEVQSARRLYGGAITLLHISILSGVAGLLSAVPCYMAAPVRNSLTNWGVEPAHPGPFFLGVLIIWQAIVFMSFRYVLAAADPHKRPDLLATLRRAGAVVVLQIAFTLAATVTARDRAPTFAEIISNIAVTSMLLIGSMLVARKVASLRRPYDEWLTLDVAG